MPTILPATLSRLSTVFLDRTGKNSTRGWSPRGTALSIHPQAGGEEFVL
jgi:hypothetical protein